MTTALLLSSLAFSHQEPTDEAAKRLEAVRTVVAFARQIEEICQPHYRTTPLTRFRAVPDLTIAGSRALPITNPDNGYAVDYGNLYGSVTSGQILVSFNRPGILPDGARSWTQEECIESARRIAGSLILDEFTLGESYMGEAPGNVLTDIVLREDPRLRVHRIDLNIDSATGLPQKVRKRLRWPEVNRDRIRGILPEEALVSEAFRVHGSLNLFPAGRLARCQLVYQVPDFRQNLNELTPVHLGNIERQEAIPLYQWLLSYRRRGHDRLRAVWVDARTGRGIAAQDLEFDYLGDAKPQPKPVSHPHEGRWRLGNVQGTFVKAEPATFEGIPTVVTNAKGEVLTLRFDAKSGLVRDDVDTFRPDAALLAAMRAQEPPRPFGKR